MNAQTEEAKDRLVDDFRRVIHDAEALLKATANQTGDNIQAIRGRAEQTVREAKAKLQDLQEGLVDRTKAAYQATDELIHDNPWQAIGVAAAVGFLLGMLTGRR
jgi:ElaB/YqjD/DUF883 family membrane-anchored ribosome-binding protein